MKINFRRIFAASLIFFAAGFQLCAQPETFPKPNPVTLTTALLPDMKPLAILTAMQRVADWQLANPAKPVTTGWIQAAGEAGMMALAGISGDAKYRDAMRAMGEANNWHLGERMYHADDQCVGQTYAELYFLYRDPKMLAPMRKHFDAILAKPSDAPSLDFDLPDKKALEQWSWCDSLFMAPPTWVRLYAATGDEKYLNFALTNFWRTTDYLYDKDEHLFYRDSTFFKKKESNGKKVFWARGNGWVMAGIVRILQYLPTNHPDRPRFEQLFKDMAEKILSCQQPDGLWHASLLDPQSYPAKETSGSGFFTYALAWGVNQGLLDRVKFEPAIQKAWTALVGCVNADGKLTNVQPIGADPKNFDADSTEPYGVGAFLLAGSEVYRMGVFENPDFKTESKINSGEIVPVIGMRDVPITEAIDNLATAAKIKYVLNSNIDYFHPMDSAHLDQNGRFGYEPEISFHWTHLTAMQALQMVLDHSNLRTEQDSKSGIFYITTRSANDKSLAVSNYISSPVILKVANPASFRRDSETVEINLDELNFPTNAVVMDGLSSKILDSQFYVSNKKPPYNLFEENLLFQVDLAPGETRTFYILDASVLAAVPPPIVKTFARYVPERHDDFAWESDRIAHRMYGPALETWQAEPLTSSGIDVWVKRTRNLVINDMYGTMKLFVTNGPSQDDFKVGKTRGDSGLGIWKDGKLYVSKNWRTWKVITTGPIRSEFELTYDAWDAGGQKISETKRISIDAGSNMSRVESTFTSDDKSPIQVGVGLAERPGENEIWPDNLIISGTVIHNWTNSVAKGLFVQDKEHSFMTYWQPQDFNKGTIGTAFILPKGGIEMFTNDVPNLPAAKTAAPTHTMTEGQPALRNQLAIANAEIGKPFIYYFGAGWSESGDFPNAGAWNGYVIHFFSSLQHPLRVTIGN